MSELIPVRHSAMKDWRQCPLKGYLGWVLNWEKTEQSGARERGNIWHELMALHYRQLRDGRTLQQAQDLALELLDVVYDKHEDYDLLYWMYEGYCERYGADEDWEILDVETTRRVPLLLADGAASRFEYEWTTDLLVRQRSSGHIIVVDHKSTGNPMRKIDIDLDDQFGLYTFAQRRRGVPALYQLYNGALTKKLKREQTLGERFQRTPSYRTDVELAAIEADALRTCESMYPPDGVARNTYSAPNPRVCSWSCDFLEVHLAMRKNRNPERILPHLMRARGFTNEGDHRSNPIVP